MSDDADRPGEQTAEGTKEIREATGELGEEIAAMVHSDDPEDATAEDVERGFGTASDALGAVEQGARAWDQTERAARSGDTGAAVSGGLGAAAASGGVAAGGLDAIGRATDDEGFREAARVVRGASAVVGAVGQVARHIADSVHDAEEAAHARSRHVEYELTIQGSEAEWSLHGFTLTETLSAPYEAVLEVRTAERDADARELLGLDVEVLLERGDHNRRFTGIVRRVEESDARGHRVSATLHVVPALWALGQVRDSVIFQGKSAKDILETVLTRALGPYSREVDVSGLAETYPPREHCVQYRESHLDFCHRLMEEEGIGYYFDFDGEGGEKLVLFDRNAQLPEAVTIDGQAIPFTAHAEVVAGAEPITKLEPAVALTATFATVRDYDWTRGTTRIEGEVAGDDEQGRTRSVYDHGHGRTATRYDFEAGGRYGENDVARQASIRRELLVRDGATLRGVSMVTGLVPGRTFEVSGHPTPGLDGEYLVTKAVHANTAPPGVEGHGGEEYHNTFECLPIETPWRPERRTPKPAIYGVQTAVVTGGNAGEIHTDEYGRIQVLFHWDREGAEPTSCWLRVAQVWAGHDGMGHPGFLFIPRVGMEVIVTFVDGDPDRPLVTGAVYNGTNLPPVGLPDEASRSMIRTRSLGGTGYNELSFEDASGNEEVHLRAERNLRELVQHDHATHVMNDQSNTVDANQTEEIGVDQTMTVHGNRTKTVDKDETNTITQNRSTDVTLDDTHHVGGTRSTTIDTDETLDVLGTRAVHVLGAAEHTHDAGWTIGVTGGITQTIHSGGWTMTTTGDVGHDVTGSVVTQASGDITVAAKGAHTLRGQSMLLRSDTSIDYLAPTGLRNLTPAAEEHVAVQAYHTVQDWFETIGGKFGMYTIALSIYASKIDISGMKVDLYGMKVDNSTFKAKKQAITIQNNTTVNINIAMVTLIG